MWFIYPLSMLKALIPSQSCNRITFFALHTCRPTLCLPTLFFVSCLFCIKNIVSFHFFAERKERAALHARKIHPHQIARWTAFGRGCSTTFGFSQTQIEVVRETRRGGFWNGKFFFYYLIIN